MVQWFNVCTPLAGTRMQFPEAKLSSSQLLVTPASQGSYAYCL